MAELKSERKDDLSNRKNLVDTAVSFLLNPNVKQRPDDAKIAFLQNKGLTDSEIAEAFSRIKFEATTGAVSDKDNQLVNAYPLPPYRSPNSFWFHLRSYTSTFVSFAVAAYVLHRFYKLYLEPWLFGSKSEKSELSALKQQLIDLNKSVSQLASTVTSLEEVVKSQMHYIDRVSLDNVESVPKSVRDILDEVSNVKSLLLNRFSFPAPPSVGTVTENKTQNGDSKVLSKTVTIPKWQLRNSEEDKSEVNSKEELEENGEGNKKSTSEPTSLENGLNSAGDQIPNEENSFEPDPKNNEELLKDPKAGLENDLCTKDKVQDENSETAIQNPTKRIKKKRTNGNSIIKSHNFLSDSKSNNQINEPTGKIDE